jgi:nucleotide-binding universal stress UspA family protein
MYALEAKTRIALKRILFATDFSPAADAAAPFASQIARHYGAKLYGAHVNNFNDYTAVAPDIWPVMLEQAAYQDKNDTRRLDEQLRRCRP